MALLLKELSKREVVKVSEGQSKETMKKKKNTQTASMR